MSHILNLHSANALIDMRHSTPAGSNRESAAILVLVTLFDLLFLVSAVAAAISLVAAAISILRGRRGRALRLLKFLALYSAAYFVMAGAVDILKPQRIIGLGQPWCFDDWCMQVDGVSHSVNGAKVRYTIQLRVFSTARGIEDS